MKTLEENKILSTITSGLVLFQTQDYLKSQNNKNIQE